MPPKRLGADQLNGAHPGYLRVLPHSTGELHGTKLTSMTQEQRVAALTTKCDLKPIGAAEARALGFAFYGPVGPCRRAGHVDIRFISGWCVGCYFDQQAALKADPVRLKAKREQERVAHRRKRMERAMEEIAGDLDLT